MDALPTEKMVAKAASTNDAHPTFPTGRYLENITRFLDAIDYNDINWAQNDRLEELREVYRTVSQHFAQSHIFEKLNYQVQKLDGVLQSITRMAVFAWPRLPLTAKIGITIQYVYTVVLDDAIAEPSEKMATFYEDLIQGRPQKLPLWQLVHEHLPTFLSHYGPYCKFNIVRSTLEFFNANWIEQYNFHGYPGANEYPLYLRRMSGLGGHVGASLFPAAEFNEKELFVEITTAIAQIQPVVIFVNDLLSLYKEYNDIRDDTCLVSNYCAVEGITVDEAMDRLTNDAIHACQELRSVFKERDAKAKDTLEAFIQGYTTWHLTDERYRIAELNDIANRTPSDTTFSEYYARATSVGQVSSDDWAKPSLAHLMETSLDETDQKAACISSANGANGRQAC